MRRTTRIARITCTIVALAAATILAREQTPISITVHVTSFDTGRPIPNARVGIEEEHADVIYSTKTDASGLAAISLSRRPGRYRVQATAGGYLTQAFGEEPALGDTLLSISANSAAIDLAIALHRGGTIAGVVTNDLKEPVIGTMVRAMRWSSVGASWRPLVDSRKLITETTKTDDHGAYRLIGLEAGQYFVSAMDGLSVAFASAARPPATLRPITIGMDAEQAGVNIQTKPAPAGAIAGSIAGPGAGAGMSILLMQESGGVGLIPIATAGVEPGSRFTIADVPVGKYELIVRPGTARVWARTTVAVTANNETAAILALHQGGRISGTIIAPARGPVAIMPLGRDHPEAGFASSEPPGSGPFVIQNIAPGRYRWWDGTNPQVAPETVMAAFVNNQDVTDLPLDIAPESTIENVRFTRTQAARVAGTMLDASGKPTSRGAVIVASTSSRDWTEATRRIRLARPDTAGFYEISSLPAGSYTVSAVTALSPGQLWDSVFLKTLAKSRQVTLTQGQTATVDLRLK